MPLHIVRVFLFAMAANGQRGKPALPDDYPYSPAFVSTINAREGHTQLVVFPLYGKAFTIPIHFASGPFTYSPDGKMLYGACSIDATRDDEPPQIGFCRVDLETGSTTPVPGTIHAAHSRIPDGDASPFSRLRGFAFPDGKLITITLQHPDASHWSYLSLSPDGKRAVATHKGRVQLIDIVDGTTEPLGDDRLWVAQWSPDGKWLAALEKGENGRTILMDASDLKPRRILGHSELDWSPDSRYLLGVKVCGPYSGTLEVINVESGERTAIKSSKCQINQATTGWVSNDLNGRTRSQ